MMEAYMQNGHHPAGMMASRTQAYSTALVHSACPALRPGPAPPRSPAAGEGWWLALRVWKKTGVANRGRVRPASGGAPAIWP